jgi:hypothetical protein
MACGLETVELGGPSVGNNAGATAANEPTGTGGEDALAADGSEASSSLPEVPPLSNLDGAGSFDAPSDPNASDKGCNKVDFLFVIDNSPSMAFAQENLKNSFNGFLKVLGESLQTNDFHIMVVDTDGGDDRNDDAAVGADRCDVTLGAGRRVNGQNDDDCQLPAAQRFVSTGQPELLDTTFSCMATVGVSGDSREQQMAAMLGAVSPAESDPGGCNAGFLRNDAILVVTIITNTDDSESLDGPQAWYDEILARKNGNEASVVMLGFFPGDAFRPSSSGVICNVIAAINRAPRLDEFVNLFTHHQVASVCEADYGPYFEAAVENIDLACDDFVAPVIQ